MGGSKTRWFWQVWNEAEKVRHGIVARFASDQIAQKFKRAYEQEQNIMQVHVAGCKTHAKDSPPSVLVHEGSHAHAGNSVFSLDSWLFPVNGIVGNVVGCDDESASKLQSVPSAVIFGCNMYHK